jgi:hypothetical protein
MLIRPGSDNACSNLASNANNFTEMATITVIAHQGRENGRDQQFSAGGIVKVEPLRACSRP